MSSASDAGRPENPGQVLRERGLWGLVVLGVAFFHRPLFFDQAFFYRDVYLYFLPMRRLYSELLRGGEWLLWNPYLHGGLPFVADFSSSALYPSQLLYLLLPAERALSVEIAVHVILASAAAYVLARVLGVGPPAATVSGLVFGYCGFALSQANLMRLMAYPYLALVVLFWHLYLTRKRRRWLLLAIACGALQVLAGVPESVAFTFAVALGWGLALPAGGASRPRRALLWVVLSVAVAGLAAVQLVPGFEMVAQSQRGEGLELEAVGAHSVDPRRLPELVVPGFLGRTDRILPGDYWGSGIVDGAFPLVLSLYVGLVPTALALLAAGAAVRRGRPLDRYLAALALLALVLCLGRLLPFFEAVYRWVPGVQVFRYPVKYLMLGTLPLALLAGRGFEALFGSVHDRGRGSEDRRPLVLAWGVAAALGLFVTCWGVFPGFAAAAQELFFARSDELISEGLRGSLLQVFGIWLLAVLIYQMHRLRARPWLPWALSAVVALDLLSAGRLVNPTAPSDRFLGVPPAAELALRHVGDGRVYRDPVPSNLPLLAPTGEIAWLYRWNQEVLKDYLGATYRLPMIYHTDFHGLAPRRVMRLKWTVEAVPWEQKLPLLSAASVRLIVTHEDLDLPGLERLTVIENASRVPFYMVLNHYAAEPVRLVTRIHRAADLDEAVGAMLAPGFDPRVHAVLEGFPPAPSPNGCHAAAEIETLEATFRRRTVAVDSVCAGALVFSEVWYPGWEARVDGRRVPLVRANAAFQAVWLEPGSHRVELRFVPRSLYWGFAVSVLTLGVLARACMPERAGG